MSDNSAMPATIAALPRDNGGNPIPWFAAWDEGVVDYRLTAPGKLERAEAARRCWICGRRLHGPVAFLVGPMGAVARVSPWPPSHRDCVLYAVQHCPFLQTTRQTPHLGEPADDAATRLDLARGIVVVWLTPDYGRTARGGVPVLVLGEPSEVLWFRQGRPATHEEARQAVISATTVLLRAVKPHDRTGATELGLEFKRALAWLPHDEADEEMSGMGRAAEPDADQTGRGPRAPDRSLQP